MAAPPVSVGLTVRQNGAVVIGRRGQFERDALVMDLYARLVRRFGASHVAVEYAFAAPRRWRWDLALPQERIAIEFQGYGPGGGHGRAWSGLARDSEKYREAAARGWLIHPVLYADLKTRMPEVLNAIERSVGWRRASEGRSDHAGVCGPTVTGDGVEALIAPYYTSGSGETCSSTKAPLPTLTTKDRLGLVLPITHTGRRDARSVEEPIPTVTTAHRGELAFITAGFGERDGQAARVRSVEAPAFTVCAQGHIGLVEGQGYDILFRMLQPHELAAAMGFNTDETQYEFSGTKTDVIRQIGNAIPVNLAAALVKALMENRS